MLYQKATMENGQMKVLETKVVDQSKLTSDCWIVQIEGLKACKKCQYNGTKNCGGQNFRKLKKTTFKWLTGDVNWRDYGGKWISNKLNNGKYDYWFVIDFVNLYEACGEREANEMGGKYSCSLEVVSPSLAGEENLKKALQGWDMEDKPLSELSDEMKVELLSSYGVHAAVWSECGKYANKLIAEAKKQAKTMGELEYNQAMNTFANALGHTREDFLRGDLSFETAIKNRKAAGIPC